jgi:hypothetical protein
MRNDDPISGGAGQSPKRAVGERETEILGLLLRAERALMP